MVGELTPASVGGAGEFGGSRADVKFWLSAADQLALVGTAETFAAGESAGKI